MLMPGRHANTSDYRYGFQGQEMDDEIKGEGNSLNYTFRMHDPRVGRFFAIDPLINRYPFYSSYSFSGNKVISHVELEGLEDVTYLKVYQDEADARHKVMTKEEIERENLIQNILWTGAGAIILDIVATKGKATRYLVKQFATQTAVNVTVNGISAVFSANNKFDPVSAVSESFTGFDLGDAGLDKSIEILADKYKIGKIQKALEIVAPSLFDITIDGGVQFVGINKESSAIVTDIVGNILTEGVETKLKNNGAELPTIKLSAAKEAEVIGELIMQKIEATVESMGDYNFNNNFTKRDEREQNEKKRDGIPNLELKLINN